jgi:ubiquitin carboxyl-terminal hydrolase 34
MSKNCIKLLCEDPVFAEYIKCILMDERTFLNNNIVYTFMTHFLLKVCVVQKLKCVISDLLMHVFIMLVFWQCFENLFQVQSQVFSEANCANLISTLITNLINQYQNLQSDFTNRVEISKASASLNGVRSVQRSRHVHHNFPKISCVFSLHVIFLS